MRKRDRKKEKGREERETGREIQAQRVFEHTHDPRNGTHADALLRTHCGDISPLSLFPFLHALRKVLHLPLAHATKLPFDVKQPNRLSLRPLLVPPPAFLPFSSYFSVFFLPRAIIAFVLLRLLVVLNFHVSPPREKNSEKREREREDEEKEERNEPISISRGGSLNVATFLVKEGPCKKKGPRARVCLSELN